MLTSTTLLTDKYRSNKDHLSHQVLNTVNSQTAFPKGKGNQNKKKKNKINRYIIAKLKKILKTWLKFKAFKSCNRPLFMAKFIQNI